MLKISFKESKNLSESVQVFNKSKEFNQGVETTWFQSDVSFYGVKYLEVPLIGFVGFLKDAVLNKQNKKSLSFSTEECIFEADYVDEKLMFFSIKNNLGECRTINLSPGEFFEDMELFVSSVKNYFMKNCPYFQKYERWSKFFS